MPSDDIFEDRHHQKQQSTDFNQILYSYPADNDYKSVHGGGGGVKRNESIFEKRPEPNRNVYEFQPRHHRTVANSNQQTNGKKLMPKSSVLSNGRSPSSGRSSRSVSQQTNSRYINPASFETPI